MMHLIANSFINNANLAVVLCFVHEREKKSTWVLSVVQLWTNR
jgi:hypothetical protein